MPDVEQQPQTGAGPVEPPAAGRKPWIRPSFELASIDETESGPMGGVDGSSSIS